MSDPLEEAIDLIEDLVEQGCWWAGKDGKDGSPVTFGDMAISTYEGACNYLAYVRPERWKREPYGLRRLDGSR